MTVIAGGNALGTHMPPFFVFSCKRMLSELLSSGMPETDGGVLRFRLVQHRTVPKIYELNMFHLAMQIIQFL